MGDVAEIYWLSAGKAPRLTLVDCKSEASGELSSLSNNQLLGAKERINEGFFSGTKAEQSPDKEAGWNNNEPLAAKHSLKNRFRLNKHTRRNMLGNPRI